MNHFLFYFYNYTLSLDDVIMKDISKEEIIMKKMISYLLLPAIMLTITACDHPKGEDVFQSQTFIYDGTEKEKLIQELNSVREKFLTFTTVCPTIWLVKIRNFLVCLSHIIDKNTNY